MLVSYFVGQRYYPINYPIASIMSYVALAAVLFAAINWSNAKLPMPATLALNTLFIIVFAAVIVRRDFPLASLPVVGRYFRKK